MDVFFILGRTHELALAELESVLTAQLPESNLESLYPTVIQSSLPSREVALSLQERLGGVIKIVAIDTVRTGDIDLSTEVTNLLFSLREEGKSIHFGIAEIGRDHLPAVHLPAIKKELVAKGVSARFVEAPRYGLSASVLLHQNVDEIVVVKHGDQTFIGHTITIQNIDEWTQRDRAKPYADKKHGMLPPKIARTLLNLAVPGVITNKRVLDPFCGTGTVLLEAAACGAVPIGSDIREDAVQQTRGNLQWFFNLSKEAESGNMPTVILSDATHLTPEHLGGKVDAIVAEGYLGPLTPNPAKIPNIFKGLEKLYLGAFKRFSKILEDGARVCIALPRIEVGKKVYTLSPLIDTLEGIGYNQVLSPLRYERPDAIVKREIFTLEFTSKKRNPETV